MGVIIDPYHFTSCKDCVHNGMDEGRNVNYMGNCEDCVHNPDRVDYFYHNIYAKREREGK